MGKRVDIHQFKKCILTLYNILRNKIICPNSLKTIFHNHVYLLPALDNGYRQKVNSGLDKDLNWIESFT